MLRTALSIAVMVIIGGCAASREFARDLNIASAQAMGSFTAPLLAGAPRPSGCTFQDCLALDGFEKRAYEALEQDRITYIQLVEWFYEQRKVLFPHSNDSQNVEAVKAFQRLLALHVDQGKVPKSDWPYLVERKLQEYALLQRQRTTTCTTTNAGTSVYPVFRTVCKQ